MILQLPNDKQELVVGIATIVLVVVILFSVLSCMKNRSNLKSYTKGSRAMLSTTRLYFWPPNRHIVVDRGLVLDAWETTGTKEIHGNLFIHKAEDRESFK